MIKKVFCYIFIITVCFCTVINANASNIVYRCNSNDNKKIALTFDDGPHPYRTSEILDVLDRYNIKATFFVIGQNINNYPDIFEKIVSAGHEVGNHTYTHQSLKNCNIQLVEEEISSFNRELSKFNCKIPTIIRPPGGLFNSTLQKYADCNGYNVILWSVDTLDWAHTNATKIAEKVIANTESGDIILMHDYVCDKSPTKDAIERFIPILIEKGFEFVTVSELIKENAR